MAMVPLLIILLGGFLLRLHNLSPFKFYPDAYQNLIVAHNIANYRSVWGYLGEYGMLYPYYFMWTRPGYPLLINIVDMFVKDPIVSAQLIAFVCGVISIILSFYLIRSVFNSSRFGIIAAILTATSFNHTVWGGFIYTETTGILLMQITLILLFRKLTLDSKWADLNDLLTGVVMTFAIFTRYEYAVFIIPLIMLIAHKNPTPLIKILNIGASLLLTTTLFVYALYPIPLLYHALTGQLSRFIVMISAGTLGISGYLLFKNRLLEILAQFSKPLNTTIITGIWLIGVLLVILNLVPNEGIAIQHYFAGIRDFVSTDILLSLSSVIGLTYLLLNKSYRIFGYFVLLTLVILYPIYYQINPAMQRYWTHALPFLLIPASMGMSKILYGIQDFYRQKKMYVSVVATLFIIFTFVYQTYLTYQGIRYWDDGGWFRTSYDEKSSHLVKQSIDTKDGIIIASMPEPYFTFTNMSTHSIIDTDTAPYLVIPELDHDPYVYIIQDMGMIELFPNFSRFLNTNLAQYKISQYSVGESYRYSIQTHPETQPVQVYKIKQHELITKITESQLK
jgi:hypothetical protein